MRPSLRMWRNHLWWRQIGPVQQKHEEGRNGLRWLEEPSTDESSRHRFTGSDKSDNFQSNKAVKNPNQSAGILAQSFSHTHTPPHLPAHKRHWIESLQKNQPPQWIHPISAPALEEVETFRPPQCMQMSPFRGLDVDWWRPCGLGPHAENWRPKTHPANPLPPSITLNKLSIIFRDNNISFPTKSINNQSNPWNFVVAGENHFSNQINNWFLSPAG